MRLIDADKLEEILNVNVQELQEEIIDAETDVHKVVNEAQLLLTIETIKVIRQQPTAFAKSIVDQYQWEADVAISQLEQLGIKFGEKLDDDVIKEVNRIITNSRVSEVE